jgi:hypothetical protein
VFAPFCNTTVCLVIKKLPSLKRTDYQKYLLTVYEYFKYHNN